MERVFHSFVGIFVCLKVPIRWVLRVLKQPFFGEFRSLKTPIRLIYFRSLISPKRLAFRNLIKPKLSIFRGLKTPKSFIYFSGALKCQKGFISGLWKSQNGRQILYPTSINLKFNQTQLLMAVTSNQPNLVTIRLCSTQ